MGFAPACGIARRIVFDFSYQNIAELRERAIDI
jgi:hypothetical protein